MKTFLPIAAIAAMALSGCATTQVAKNSSREEKQSRMRTSERESRRKEAALQAELQDMRERNLVLERRAQNRARPAIVEDARVSQTIPVPFDPTAALSDPPNGRGVKPSVEAQFLQSRQQSPKKIAMTLPTRVTRMAESQLRPDLESRQSIAGSADAATTGETKSETKSETKNETSGEREQTGEQRLYSKVLETFRRHDLAELQKSLQFLLKAYPDSIYADNALYTAGILALEKNDDSRAHHYMTRVVREFPRGNKAVSALFALAMIEKKRNKLNQAQNILKNLQRLYPGSPEASRAGMEAKLIKSLSAKSREG